MRVARVRHDGRVRAAQVIEGGFRLENSTASGMAPHPADPLLDRLRSGAALHDWRFDGPEVHGDDVTVLAPVWRPGKMIAIGLNYGDHTAETGLQAPAEPLTFAKYPTCIAGPTDDIRVPAAVTTQVDWEVELAMMIGIECGPGRRGTLVDVAAYTVANDVSARDLQFRDQQWTRAKSIDTFCPLGPHLVTADELNDPEKLRIWASVNGTAMQDASTADLIFGLTALLDFLTATVTLEPGDVILTGTPPGVGAFRNPPIFLQDGDTVCAGVEDIGELRNTVRWV